MNHGEWKKTGQAQWAIGERELREERRERRRESGEG